MDQDTYWKDGIPVETASSEVTLYFNYKNSITINCLNFQPVLKFIIMLFIEIVQFTNA